MENPLILPLEQAPLTQLLGHQSRTAARKKKDASIVRIAMGILEKHLPEMFDSPPSSVRFAAIWPTVDTELRQELKTEIAYRRGYGFICRQLEQGNRQGLWQINTPSDYLTLRRARPLRSLSWQQTTAFFASKASGWLDKLQKTTDPQQCFARLLMSSICHGGLNRPALWPALALALTKDKPLNGNTNYCWIPLHVSPSNDFASNTYHDNGGIGLGEAQVEVQFIPDPISLGFLWQFLSCRTNDWSPPKSVNACVSLLKSELGVESSASALSKGGVSFAEVLPGINLPQVLVEYAVGRQKSASLPTPYCFRLLSNNISFCRVKRFDEFAQWQNLQRTKSIAPVTPRRSRISNRYLLDQLREIFKQNPARPQGKSVIVSKLKRLSETALGSNEQILLHWLLHHLEAVKNEVSTAKRYFSAIGADWLAGTESVDLYSLDTDEFIVLYQAILNRRTKTNHYNAGRLEDMHRFAQTHFDLPPLCQPLSEGSADIPHVSAAIVDEALFTALLNHIACLADLNYTMQRMLQCYLIIAYRTGLRPGEVSKLRLKDIEPSEIGWLFVRESRHGHNKTDSALRKVPLFPFLTEKERHLVKNLISERELACSNNIAELLFHEEGNPYEVLNNQQISQMVSEILSQLSGGVYYRLYHMRHTALSRLQLLAHEDLVTLPSFTQSILPYDKTQRDLIRRLIFGKGRLRDRYTALAVFAGHSSPDITLRSYLHFTDLLLGCHLASNAQTLNAHIGHTVLGVPKHRYAAVAKTGNVTPSSLRPFFQHRLKKFIHPIKSLRKATADNKFEVSRENHYVQALAVLERIQAGHNYQEVTLLYRLPLQRIKRWLSSAEALKELTTPRGVSRLFSKQRAYALLPSEPTNIDDRKDISSALAVCRKLKSSQLTKAELCWAIEYCLTHSTSSHTWIHFERIVDFQRFMALVSQLFPWERWALELRYPYGKKMSGWRCHQLLKITRYTLKKVNQYPEGSGYLYLRHRDEQHRIINDKYHRLSRYSSPSLQVLFHRLAIILFTDEGIKAWGQR
ncbi:tyrosine-type recombinase/integrase [Shewanella indica]|uniref:tyrosine-type recombinase/integrase n=1 Tax=Shewanella indica TaxID=768528 RepID=UPI000C34C2ED|nr:tyrosine-type recombinase/integrase [Shewanella indica]